MASSSIMKKTLKIDGMTCVNCENRIERKLKNTPGILEAKVSYSGGTAAVTYDNHAITQDGITEIIEKLDYKVKSAVREDGQNASIVKTLGVVLILFALYMLASRLGGLNIFNAFPQAEKNMGYGMLFVIGLLTSVHCVAMCGGIGLSQCVPQGNAAAGGGKLSTLRPSFLYNLGRVISYTVVGGIVGAIGSVVSFSGAFKGVVQLAAGVFMVIMGLNMLNLFPWLKKLNPRMPKIFARKINREKGRSNSPLYVGLLNGLMPCGPLQAMQLYALSTGNPLTGALSMLLFSLGTVPLMFGLGALSSILSKKFTHRMMRVSAVLVTMLGVFMFSSGMSLSGVSLPIAGGSAKSGNAVVLRDGIQLITTGLPSGQYQPITVQKGIPVKWTIQAQEGDINGCNNKIVIPKYNKELQLKAGDNIVEFTPSESGVIPYSCWMGMIKSQITVVDDMNGATASSPLPQGGGGV
jgi:sulfite exporter TauE/SafE/copper chaperone CopZ